MTVHWQMIALRILLSNRHWRYCKEDWMNSSTLKKRSQFSSSQRCEGLSKVSARQNGFTFIRCLDGFGLARLGTRTNIFHTAALKRLFCISLHFFSCASKWIFRNFAKPRYRHACVSINLRYAMSGDVSLLAIGHSKKRGDRCLNLCNFSRLIVLCNVPCDTRK